nr:phage tail tape measure protein [Staphylococcus nepalensis]
MPAVAAMGGAIKSSVEWEQALAGVAKTTDMTGKELQGMGSEITAMSNKMPFAATEIAGVAEAAGQLGVKKSEITDFTETMMNMSVATNLTADEAATEFARFANAAGMPIEDVDRLGAAVVNLGNTTATTEAEIVEMGQRLAGAGAQAGFSADEIMSISAAMSSVGINAEAGGTAMTQIFNKITKATADGGATLDNFAKVAGMSAEQFSSTWEDNPTKALAAFVKGLGDTEGGAKGVLRALEDVGIKGIREADTIRRMSNNHKILDEALKTGAEGWKENTALTDEAAIRYETMGSKLSILRNTFVNFLRTVGDAVAPAVIKLSDILTGLFEKLQHTSKGTRIAIAVFAGLSAIIPPLLISGGLLLVLLSNMAKSMIFLGSLSKGGGILAGLKVAFSSLLGPIGQVVTKIPLIAPALGALSGPIGWITLALVGIGTALVVAYKKSETFRNIVNGALSAVVTGFKALWSGVVSVITPIGQAIAQFGGEIASTFSKFWQQDGPMLTQAFRNILAVAAPIFRSLGTVVKTVFNGIRTVITTVLSTLWPIISPIILALRSQFTIAFGFIKNTVVNVFNLIKGVISGVLNVVLGIVKIFGGLLTGNWSAVWQGILMIVKGILNVILSVGQFVLNQFLNVVKFVMASVRNAFTNGITIAKNIVIGALKIMLAIAKGILNGLLAFVKFIWTSIKTATSVLWNAIKFAVLTPVRALYQGSIKLFNNLRSGTINIFNAVKNFALKVWTLIKNRVIANAKLLWAGVKATFNLLKKGVSAIFNSVKNFVIKLWTNIKNRVVKLAKTLWNNVRNTFNSLRKGVSSIFNAVKNLAIKIWSNIKSRVTNFARGLWNGVRNTFSSLRKGVSNIFNNVKNNAINTWNSIKSKLTGIATNIWNAVKNTFNTMKNGLKGIIDDIKGHITDMVDAVKSGLNGLIKGLNWVGGKLGLPKIPKLSTGTQVINRQIKTTSDGSLKQGTMAVVGDKGPGNGKGKNGRREMIRYPNGRTALTPARDTTTYLPKGSSVINGATTQKMLSTGTLPHFSLGSLAKDAWDGTKSGAKWLGKKASGGYKKAKEAVTGGAKWLSSKVKDVMDYADNPGKLLDLALKAFGVDFSQFKNDNIVGEMTQAGWKKIKSAAIDWIKGGMEEAEGGDGDAAWLLKHDIWQKFGNYTGGLGFNGGKHYGVDFGMTPGTNVKAVAGGKVSKVWNDYGGGKSIEIDLGKGLTNWYMHLSKQLVKQGQRVDVGDLIAKSGNTGAFTAGSGHLHFQLNKNGKPQSNVLEWLEGLGSDGGKGGKYKSTVKKALTMAGLPTSGKYVNAWMKQIQTESTGNPKAKNPSGASGLVQVKPATFAANKLPGYGNIWKPLDNLIAGMRYAKGRYGTKDMLKQIGHGLPYATGGLIKSAGWYNIAEAGYPEWVIPTDPNRQSDAMKLLALAAQDIDSKNKRNKRPNQMRTPSTGYNDTQNSGLEQKMDVLISLMSKLVESNDTIANKDTEISLDGRLINKNNNEQQALAAMTQLMRG